ncbi:MAG: hypothetical protein ACRDTA_24360 [Pseudonocardiaceae bacterium]
MSCTEPPTRLLRKSRPGDGDTAEAAGFRHPTPAELQDQRDKARIELDKAEAGRRQVQARHDEIVATVARTNENQAQQIKALHAEQVELQQQLRSQDAEMARLREQFEDMSRRAGRARAEADRAQAEVAGARSDPDQGDIDLAFIVGQVMSTAAPDQRTPSISDAAEGVRQDRDPDNSLAAPTEVRITPETSADRKEWNQEREQRQPVLDWVFDVCFHELAERGTTPVGVARSVHSQTGTNRRRLRRYQRSLVRPWCTCSTLAQVAPSFDPRATRRSDR